MKTYINRNNDVSLKFKITFADIKMCHIWICEYERIENFINWRNATICFFNLVFKDSSKSSNYECDFLFKSKYKAR